MPIELSHLGEDLIAEILRSLAKRRDLGQVMCAVTGQSLEQDVRDFGLGDLVNFRADDALLTVHNCTRAYDCDGEQKVDVLCTGNGRAIAFEAKLGYTRLGSADFRKRFCTPCVVSAHSNLRVSGSMVSVLERSLPFDGGVELIAHVAAAQWTIARPWWLVLRQKVLDRWRSNNGVPVTAARLLSFESLAEVYGSQREFDQLVRRVVGGDFFERWKISSKEPL
jgi:hypothetical protein